MDSPLFTYILIGALALGLGPVLMIMGLRAYSGRWTSWLTFTAQTTAKHSRAGFVMFWGGLGVTGSFLVIGLRESGVAVPGFQVLGTSIWGASLAIAMMHQFFLPKILRPVLLPRWYREWEAVQFEREAQETELRRTRRERLRKLPRAERRRERLKEKGPAEPMITVVDEKVIWSKTGPL